MKNLVKSTLLFIAVSALLISCGTNENNKSNKPGQLEGTITISGAFALYPMANTWATEFHALHPGVKFNVSAGGAGKGMADVLAGVADLGMFSKEISQGEIDKGAYGIAVTKDAVLCTVSDKNPVLDQLKKEGLKKSDFAQYFLTDGKKYWKNSKNEVSVYTRADACGAAEVWVRYMGGKSQEELKGIAVYGDPGLAEAVKNDPKGIGFNNVIYVYDYTSGNKYPGVEVVPIDINENGVIDPEEDFYNNMADVTKAIAEGRYPSPPARPLYFVSKNKPTNPAVIAFLQWILDQGQNFVVENGYILLDKAMIEEQKLRLQ